jgi:NAD(P)H dehydrogenase (quinone)
MTKIAIVYYSLYGHVATLAESVAEGLKAGGATVDIYQVAETLPDAVLEKMS